MPETPIRQEPILLTNARNTSLENLASWSTPSVSGNPAQDRRHKSRTTTAASVAVAVERVGTACTLPFDVGPNHVGRRRQPGESLIIPPRLDGSGRGWRSPGGLPFAALVRLRVWHKRRSTRRLRCPCPSRRRGAAPASRSDPVLARKSVPAAGRNGSRRAPARSPPAPARRRGCRGGPQRCRSQR